jgi:hypothetical protein
LYVFILEVVISFQKLMYLFCCSPVDSFVLSYHRHIASTVIQVLETVGTHIDGDVEKNDLLVRLLELFCQIGIKIKEINEKITTKHTQKVSPLSGVSSLTFA